MKKTILFSPVGGTDPISYNNMYDGSMLHICRWYKPDEVYLYMSKEMLDFQEQDDRYRYCIKKLSEKQRREILIHEIERPELTNVQDFNFFYEEFKTCLRDIIKNNEDADVLINISSGTPAMKSGLLVLVTLGEFDCKTIQVITPEKHINEHNHKEYNVEDLWELNQDNEEGAENRCEMVICPSLSNIKQEEILKQLVRKYDYKAAISVAETLPIEITKNYMELLKVAYSRLQLESQVVYATVKKLSIPGFPIKADDVRKYFEYALALNIKFKKGEYGDFIRAISPILLDLFCMILKKEANIDISDYIDIEKNIPKWSRIKLNGTKLEGILMKEFNNEFDYKNVYSIQILKILEYKCLNNKALDAVKNLRAVESKVRNIAAHEVVSVTEKMIKDRTGYTPDQIMGLIKESFKYTNLNISKDYWNAYDEMNEYIISRIG